MTLPGGLVHLSGKPTLFPGANTCSRVNSTRRTASSGLPKRIIDRLGRFHDRVTPLLNQFAVLLPRLGVYRDGLLAALERAEDGDIAFVSDVGCESYHTLWFDLHEELLRLSGTERVE